METLGVRRRSTAGRDAHGNAAVTYGTAQPWSVWALAPGDNLEPSQANRERSDIAWTVYAAKDSAVPTERDLVVVDDAEFQVDGRAEDWTRSPWGAGPAGVVVKLKRMEG